MKVYFEKGGVLVVEAETPIEEFALWHWNRNGEPHGVLKLLTESSCAVHNDPNAPTAFQLAASKRMHGE